MFEYSIIESIPRRWITALFCAAAMAVLWGLVLWYSDIPPGPALGISISFVAILVPSVFFYRLLTFFLRSLILRSLVGLMAFSLVLAFTAGVSVLAGWCRWEQYGKLVPLLTLYGGMVWMIPMLLSRKESEAKNGEIAEEGEITETEKQEILDRISVKKGSEIHIIKVGELRYIQADGDYVHLFTDDAKYLKEQTMKYFETRLPDNFVRIHRSCIVNVDEITRVELFGKESYNVKIRNGVTLKASVAGYKSLKNRLCL